MNNLTTARSGQDDKGFVTGRFIVCNSATVCSLGKPAVAHLAVLTKPTLRRSWVLAGAQY